MGRTTFKLIPLALLPFFILLIFTFLVTDDVLLDGYVAADKVGRYA